MNRKQYKKKLEKLIREDNLYLKTIDELIILDSQSWFNRGKVIDYINEDMEFIISKCDLKRPTIEYLYSFDKLKPTIEKNIIKYLTYLDYYGIASLLPIEDLNLMDKINENFNYFLDCVSLENVIRLFYMNKHFKLNDDNKKILNRRIKDNKIILAKAFFFEDYKTNPESNEDYYSVLEVIVKIIDELLEVYHLTYVDIKYIDKGAFSKVFLIGDKVLKLGKKRTTYNMPNDKRLLAPLIRVNLRDISDVDGTIEVVNRVDTDVSLTDDELYEFYKELRSRGIKFTDIRPNNFGYLLSSNGYHFEKKLADDPKSRGLTGGKVEELPKGSLVIIDSDYLYPEKANPKMVLLYKQFENRYQMEMNMKFKEDDIDNDLENKPKLPKI